MKKNESIKILVCHHKKGPYIKNECILPIQVGKALKDFSLDYCIKDDTGVNISARNTYWCELTALYWAWKNLDADYYGLMHYRRYLSFEDNTEYKIVTSLENKDLHDDLSPKNIKKFCESADIITGPVWDIHPVGIDNILMNSYEFYKREHYQSDMDITLNIIKTQFPDYYYAALDGLTATHCFFMNLMVMKKHLFYKYCEFLFGVLFAVEKEISNDLPNRDAYQKRVFGFIAERLSNIFVIYCKQRNSSIRVKQTGMYFLASKNHINAKQIIQYVINRKATVPLPGGINVCMSFDDNYLKPALTTIISLLLHTKSHINFYFLSDKRLSDKSRKIVEQNISSQGTVNFLDINSTVLHNFPLNRSYISINTYYRLLIHDIINVDKIIYLDSDIIVADDIAKLWNISMNNACIAGALDEGGVTQSRRLKLGNDSTYVNAGILVFNLKNIRRCFQNPMQAYLEAFYFNRKWIILQDQDILNIVFKKNIFVLPLKWNINGRIFEFNELDYKYSQNNIDDALDDSGIIHYTDRKKPWTIQATHPLKELYWYYRDRVKGLPLSTHEKCIKFIQKRIEYQNADENIVIRYRNYKITLNKRIVKKLLKIFHFI